jgi:plasmid stability protein
MANVLIRDVPDEVIAALDVQAGRLGLSRNEYLRRRLAQDVVMSGSAHVSVADLTRFADDFADLANPDVRMQAWS